MATVTRKDIEQRVMALQSLAMECAKSRTVNVTVIYDGSCDEVEVSAGDATKVDGIIPLREWCGSPVMLEDALASLEQAHKDILALHNEALATMKSEHGGEV